MDSATNLRPEDYTFIETLGNELGTKTQVRENWEGGNLVTRVYLIHKDAETTRRISNYLFSNESITGSTGMPKHVLTDSNTNSSYIVLTLDNLKQLQAQKIQRAVSYTFAHSPAEVASQEDFEVAAAIVPQQPQKEKQPPPVKFTVGTYNVLAGMGIGPSDPAHIQSGGYTDIEGRIEDITANIGAADFDILCLQEVTPKMWERFQEKLPSYDFISYAVHTSAGIPHGVGIIAKKGGRIQCKHSDTLKVDAIQTSPKGSDPKTKERSHVKARFEIEGKSFVVSSSHFQLSADPQGVVVDAENSLASKEIRAVRDWIEAGEWNEKRFLFFTTKNVHAAGMAIITGDFNRDVERGHKGTESLSDRGYVRSEHRYSKVTIVDPTTKAVNVMAGGCIDHLYHKPLIPEYMVEATPVDLSRRAIKHHVSDHQLIGSEYTLTARK